MNEQKVVIHNNRFPFQRFLFIPLIQIQINGWEREREEKLTEKERGRERKKSWLRKKERTEDTVLHSKSQDVLIWTISSTVCFSLFLSLGFSSHTFFSILSFFGFTLYSLLLFSVERERERKRKKVETQNFSSSHIYSILLTILSSFFSFSFSLSLSIPSLSPHSFIFFSLSQARKKE